ncbi:hypothetical protein WSK_3844 [Novosphingobium sp. Rr 2-17]|nr:hypothetical protein WSK_3844 [Novosphingobium sp. Rr 2-17]
MPIAIKDLLSTKNHVTAAGTAILANWRPHEDAINRSNVMKGGLATIFSRVMNLTRFTCPFNVSGHPTITLQA